MELEEAIKKLTATQNFMEGIVAEIRTILGNPEAKPHGPEGSPAFITVEAVRYLVEVVNNINDIFGRYNVVNLSSALTLLVEKHFATMRQRFPMPTLLQYCQLLAPVIKEAQKKLTKGSFLYFTQRSKAENCPPAEYDGHMWDSTTLCLW